MRWERRDSAEEVWEHSSSERGGLCQWVRLFIHILYDGTSYKSGAALSHLHGNRDSMSLPSRLCEQTVRAACEGRQLLGAWTALEWGRDAFIDSRQRWTGAARRSKIAVIVFYGTSHLVLLSIRFKLCHFPFNLQPNPRFVCTLPETEIQSAAFAGRLPGSQFQAQLVLLIRTDRITVRVEKGGSDSSLNDRSCSWSCTDAKIA